MSAGVSATLESASELLKEDVEILTQLNSANAVAQNMEHQLDAVLGDLEMLLAQLDSGDSTESSHEKPEIGAEDRES
jgi:hypothetical protein